MTDEINIIEAYMEFFKDKNPESKLVDEFVAEHRQKSSGYIDLAAAFEFYNYLIENKDIIEQKTGLNINEILHPSKSPNQKWHLMISYLGMLFSQNSKPHFDKVTCPELWIWMFETSNEKDIEKIKKQALNYKTGQGVYHPNIVNPKNKQSKWLNFIKEYREKLETKIFDEYKKKHKS